MKITHPAESVSMPPKATPRPVEGALILWYYQGTIKVVSRQYQGTIKVLATQVFFICAVRTHPEARGHFDQSLWTESARRKGWFLGAGCSVGGPPGLRAKLPAIGQAAAEPPAWGYPLFIGFGS